MYILQGYELACFCLPIPWPFLFPTPAPLILPSSCLDYRYSGRRRRIQCMLMKRKIFEILAMNCWLSYSHLKNSKLYIYVSSSRRLCYFSGKVWWFDILLCFWFQTKQFIVFHGLPSGNSALMEKFPRIQEWSDCHRWPMTLPAVCSSRFSYFYDETLERETTWKGKGLFTSSCTK